MQRGRAGFLELREKAKITRVSSVSIVEGGAHDVPAQGFGLGPIGQLPLENHVTLHALSYARDPARNRKHRGIRYQAI